MIPSEGLEEIASRRENVAARDWTSGPAKLCQSLEIDSRFNGVDLTCSKNDLFIEPGWKVPEEQVLIGPRIGIDGVPETWRSKPWRYRIDRKQWNPPLQSAPGQQEE